MIKHAEFAPIHTVLIPFIHEGAGLNALEAAHHLDADIILIGVVVVPRGQELTMQTPRVRALRKKLWEYRKHSHISIKSHIIAAYEPWGEFFNMVRDESPDLLLLEFDAHLKALGITVHDVLANPPCSVALVRGRIPSKPKQVLVPLRGGPHAELALKVGLGLGLHSKGVTTLHIDNPNDTRANRDAAFQGLRDILEQMPEVEKQFAVTDDPASLILQKASQKDVIILGTTVQSVSTPTPLGPVAERILHEAQGAVIAVNKRENGIPDNVFDESSGARAISILVDKWFVENNYHASDFENLKDLVELKKKQGVSISLALPALNEEETVGKVIRTMKTELMDKHPLLDEIVLIDSDSTDHTREIAEKEGIPVYIHQKLLPRLKARKGKGEALWKSLLVTKGDIVIWIDTDIINIHPRFVYGLIGPLLDNPDVQFVKGYYRRPLRVGEKVQAGGGGRVTELTARPLLNLFYPELSGVVQPLSGEYGGRREALERATFYSGYGVETGLLIDVFEKYKLRGIAQVDLLERIHHNQHLQALSKMSFAIIQTVMHKQELLLDRKFIKDVNRSMKLIKYDKEKGYSLEVEQIAEYYRPPMIEVPEYLERKR